MKIDGDLDVSQRLGGRGKWRDLADLPKCSGIPRRLQLAKDRSLLGKCRQNGETADSQKFFKLRARVDLSVHLLAGKC